MGRCASFAYDPASFAPTYKLVLNQPGRSLAFEIASRLGVPPRVVDEARARLPESARKQEAILADLAREKAELAQDQERLLSAQAKVRELEQALSARLARIEEERERMREDTRNRIQARREAEDQRLRALFAEAEEKLKGAKAPRAVVRVRGEILSQVVPESEARAAAAGVGSLSVGDFVGRQRCRAAWPLARGSATRLRRGPGSRLAGSHHRAHGLRRRDRLGRQADPPRPRPGSAREEPEGPGSAPLARGGSTVEERLRGSGARER